MSDTDFGTFTDPRDGRAYKTVRINGQVWLAENLGYAAEGSVCYGNDPASGERYGRLYNWEMVQKAVPPGLRLPTDEEWAALIDFVGSDAGTKLKSKDYGGTDELGFSALPSGLRARDGSFNRIGEYARWWSTKEADSVAAYYYGLYYGAGSSNKVHRMHRNISYKANSFSVRLIQD